MLPKIFAKLHPKYETPYASIIFIASILGNISPLIILSVFTILFCYLITCLSVFPLTKKYKKVIKDITSREAFISQLIRSGQVFPGYLLIRLAYLLMKIRS